MKTLRFSAYWTERLKEAIIERAPESYSMSLVGGEVECAGKAVNQGIDSHLEACFVPARGDKFIFFNGRLNCEVSPESLVVLVRRLMEMDDESGEAHLLASDICGTLKIELI